MTLRTRVRGVDSQMDLEDQSPNSPSKEMVLGLGPGVT